MNNRNDRDGKGRASRSRATTGSKGRGGGSSGKTRGGQARRAPAPSGERLQKVMARAGIASRRGSEDLIREGRVTINGRIAQLGDRVQAEDAVKVGSKLLQQQRVEKPVYLAMHKPEATMTTAKDPEGRATVFDLVPKRFQRGLITVGRLDYGTEGLLLLTTDGDLAQAVAHPKHGCTKIYLVKVKGTPDEKTIERLSKGIVLDGVRLQPAKISPHRMGGQHRTARKNTWWKVEITEGRNRQVRKMFERFGHLVTRLRRIQIGPVRLGRLPKGEIRELTEREVQGLRRQSEGGQG